MGQNAHVVRAHRGMISIDWILLAVAVMVLLFCVGAFVRIAEGPQISRHEGGLLALNENDSLLLFQDFSFGADTWTPGDTTDRVAGLGPVLGPFTDAEVTNVVPLPDGTRSVHVSFDVHLTGTWTVEDSLVVIVNGERVRALTRAELSDGTVGVRSAFVGNDEMAIDVYETTISTRLAGPAFPGEAQDAFVSLRLSMQVMNVSSLLSLQLVSEVAGGGAWCLDNLAIVATTDGDAATRYSEARIQ